MEFPEIMERGGFDIVVGNPPYERIQTMAEYAPESLEFLKANYKSAASGNFDIYVCFVEEGLSLLNENGLFGYILPHKFFQADYGSGLRELLSEGKHLSEIVSFGHQQVFTRVSTYTCLLLLSKARLAKFIFREAFDLEAWKSSRSARIRFCHLRLRALRNGLSSLVKPKTSCWRSYALFRSGSKALPIAFSKG